MRCLELFQILKHKKAKGAFYLLFLFFAFLTTLNAKILIELYPTAIVKKDEVFLRDISKIKSDKDEIRLKNFLEEIVIVKFSSDIKKIEKNDVVESLKKNYIDLKNIQIIGSNKIVVKRATQKITQKEMVDDVKKFLESRFKDIKIIFISVNKKELTLPYGKIEKVVKVKSKTSKNIYLDYIIYVDGKKKISLPIKAKVLFYQLVPYAKRDIPKGKVVKKEDIYFKKKTFSRKYNFDLDEILGKIAKRTIKKDSIIKSYFLSPNFLVLKSKNVKILYSGGPISIELMGLALQNGSLGDLIEVKNVSTGKVLKCKVIAPFVVKYVK